MKKEKTKIKKAKETKNSGGINIWRFAITYLVLMGVFFFLIGFTPFQKIIDINGLYTHGVVAATAKLLGIMSIPCTYQGSIIQLPSISLDVKFGCNGLEAVMIYSVAVIAFPTTWRKRLIGIGAGFVVIQMVNILRIAALGYFGVNFRTFFDYFHIYVAQGMMIAVSLGVFFLYLNYAKETQRPLA
jgi:exosortase H (IPTLxxWG-CTERM-specific)